VPLVIQIVERIDDSQPAVVAVAIRFAKRPAFALPADAPEFGDERLPMSVVAAQPRVTHLVYEHLPFDASC